MLSKTYLLHVFKDNNDSEEDDKSNIDKTESNKNVTTDDNTSVGKTSLENPIKV